MVLVSIKTLWIWQLIGLVQSQIQEKIVIIVDTGSSRSYRPFLLKITFCLTCVLGNLRPLEQHNDNVLKKMRFK